MNRDERTFFHHNGVVVTERKGLLPVVQGMTIYVFGETPFIVKKVILKVPHDNESASYLTVFLEDAPLT